MTHIYKRECLVFISPSLHRKDPGGIYFDYDLVIVSFSLVSTIEGCVEESLQTIATLSDGSADQLLVNLLIVFSTHKPHYRSVFIVDVEVPSLSLSNISVW